MFLEMKFHDNDWNITIEPQNFSFLNAYDYNMIFIVCFDFFFMFLQWEIACLISFSNSHIIWLILEFPKINTFLNFRSRNYPQWQQGFWWDDQSQNDHARCQIWHLNMGGDFGDYRGDLFPHNLLHLHRVCHLRVQVNFWVIINIVYARTEHLFGFICSLKSSQVI